MKAKPISPSTLRLFGVFLICYVSVCNVCGCSPSEVFFSPHAATGGVMDCSTFNFNHKDTLFLFTDGIFEEFNPVQFEDGYNDLKTFIQKYSDTSAEETINAIKNHLEHNPLSIQQKDDELIIGIDFV